MADRPSDADAASGRGWLTLPGAAVRITARALTEAVAESDPELLRFNGTDLAPALEQHLLFLLREDRAGDRPVGPPTGALAARTMARLARAAPYAATRPRTTCDSRVAVLALQRVNEEILRPISAELVKRGGAPPLVVRAGPAAMSRDTAAAVGIQRYITPDGVAAVASFATRVVARWPGATCRWRTIAPSATWLSRRAADGAINLAFDAARTAGFLDALRPRIVVAFDEIGTWARLFPAMARARDVSTLDVPHAEAADAVAIAGASWDRFAVYGPLASRVVRDAGVPPDRITEIGAPRFDRLIAAAAEKPRGRTTELPRRVLFAAQHLRGGMTREVRAATLAAAVAAAEAVEPSELLIRPHPVERRDEWDGILGELSIPGRLPVRVERDLDLHALLLDAWLLVTGWSNSVYEALLADVPAIAVNATGGPDPMPFVHESLALGATDPASAGEAARLLLDDAERDRIISIGKSRLVSHLGPLDGRASSRAADLIMAGARL